MEDLKPAVAKNITDLRTAHGLTQLELAEKLNYSDKAVSKWERGESIPDIAVLKQIADLFGVSLDYMVSYEHKTAPGKKSGKTRNHGFITGMSILLVWLIATFSYVIVQLVAPLSAVHWLSFVYAVPVSMIVWLVLNSVWFDRRRNYLIISLLMWSVLGSVYISFLPFGFNVWLIFLLGIPGQIIILFWSRLKFRS